MKPIRRKIGRWSLGLLVIGSLASSLAFLPRNPQLMAHAKEITVLNAYAWPSCQWMSDQTGILPIYYEHSERIEFARLDAATGTRIPLDAFNSKYQPIQCRPRLNVHAHSGGYMIFDPERQHDAPDYSMSADRKWLLFAPYEDDVQPVTYIAATLDGTKEVRWKADYSYSGDSSGLFWLHDNHHWLEMRAEVTSEACSYKILVYDIDKPSEIKSLSIPDGVDVNYPVGITRDDRLLCMPFPMYDFLLTSVEVVDYGLLSPSTAAHKFSIPLPRPARVCAMILSPQGDRIAWRLEYDVISPFNNLLHRLKPSIPLKPQRMMGLWASDLDGSHMIEVGTNLLLPGEGDDDGVHNLQWFPDEKQISFVYKGALYTVPVP